MQRLLLDSCIVIDVLRARQDRHIWLAAQATAGHELHCSVLTITEVLAGMRPHEQPRTLALLANLTSLDVTYSIAEHAGLLAQQWRSRGVTLSLPDTTIAATAIAHGLMLVTDNHKDFPMPELTLVDV
jgi:predicted nucleic acid-binding protein